MLHHDDGCFVVLQYVNVVPDPYCRHAVVVLVAFNIYSRPNHFFTPSINIDFYQSLLTIDQSTCCHRSMSLTVSSSPLEMRDDRAR
jgi:hypothetical protein